MDLSVVICTRNRCGSLAAVLDALLPQADAAPAESEILVVDNGSTDRTADTVAARARGARRPVRCVAEPRRGLSAARNRGVRESTGEIIAFIDDDVIPDARWMASVAECFRRFPADAMGGRIVPGYTAETPQWVRRHADILAGPIVRYDYGEDVLEFHAERMELPVGANMAVRRSVPEAVSGFRTDLGAGSGALGEDSEFFLRLRAAGRRLYYGGTALVWHPVDPARTTLRYLARWSLSAGRGIVRAEAMGGEGVCGRRRPGGLAWTLGAGVFPLLRGIAGRRRFLREWMDYFRRAGMADECRRRRGGCR